MVFDIIKKKVRIVLVKRFLKKNAWNNKNEIDRYRKRKQWKKCVLDIISDMDLTSTSLGSKELSCIFYKCMHLRI